MFAAYIKRRRADARRVVTTSSPRPYLSTTPPAQAVRLGGDGPPASKAALPTSSSSNKSAKPEEAQQPQVMGMIGPRTDENAWTDRDEAFFQAGMILPDGRMESSVRSRLEAPFAVESLGTVVIPSVSCKPQSEKALRADVDTDACRLCALTKISHEANEAAGIGNDSSAVPAATPTPTAPAPETPVETTKSTGEVQPTSEDSPGGFGVLHVAPPSPCPGPLTESSPAVDASMSHVVSQVSIKAKRKGCTPTEKGTTLADLDDPPGNLRVPEYTYTQLLQASFRTCYSGREGGKFTASELVAAIAVRFPRWVETDHWKTASSGIKTALANHLCFTALAQTPDTSTRDNEITNSSPMQGGAVLLWSCDESVSFRKKRTSAKKRKTFRASTSASVEPEGSEATTRTKHIKYEEGGDPDAANIKQEDLMS